MKFNKTYKRIMHEGWSDKGLSAMFRAQLEKMGFKFVSDDINIEYMWEGKDGDNISVGTDATGISVALDTNEHPYEEKTFTSEKQAMAYITWLFEMKIY